MTAAISAILGAFAVVFIRIYAKTRGLPVVAAQPHLRRAFICFAALAVLGGGGGIHGSVTVAAEPFFLLGGALLAVVTLVLLLGGLWSLWQASSVLVGMVQPVGRARRRTAPPPEPEPTALSTRCPACEAEFAPADRCPACGLRLA